VKDESPGSRKGQAAEPPRELGSFEDSVRRLGEIVERLESGELPLEESLTLFEEGVRLARASQQELDRAERRVEQLLGIDRDGNPLVTELESE
jgi:exodeoxyribonuclease VII small subunit